ncbi:piRNA biogenesis protein EXD1-like [Mytilus trossulus]|uniref:piRNA biogenesis protein EXD1-like n=1 Tax=Mytilus trossulus TaxID=6551 RepID=UPI0030078A65
MATKRKLEPDDEDQQQQSDGTMSDKKVKQNSANHDTSLDEHKVNETNGSHTDDAVKRESPGSIFQSRSIQLRNSEPDSEDQQQQSDGSTSNANRISDNNEADVLFTRESDGEQKLSGSTQLRNSDQDNEEDQQQQSDGSTINANNISDSNSDDVLYRRKAAVETTQSGTIQVGINETSSYKYIDTKGKFSSAINDLNNKIKDGKTIALDCEGVDLSRFGCVTMVNVGTKDMVYLIDVLKIGDSVFDDGLRSILENNTIEKLMFDCREDADALFHLHKVNLDGVLDVQLLELSNRIYRNGYTILGSLEKCLQNFLSDDTLLRLKKQGRETMLNTNNIWKDRPLSESMLKYAAVDVLALFKLYDKFKNRMTHNTWKAASNLYCNNKRSRARTYRDGDAHLPIRVRDIIL